MFQGICPGYASAEEIPRLKIVTSEYPPYNYLENDQPTGFCTEVVESLLNTLNIHTPITTLPWARAYQTARKRSNTLIYTIARTTEREKQFHWIGILVTGKSYLFSLKSRYLRFSSLDQVRPFRIGAAREDIRARFLKDKGILGLDLVIHSRMNAVKLLNQRIDLWAEDEISAVHTIRQLGYEPGDTLSKALPLDIRPAPRGYLAISMGTDPELMGRLRKAYADFLTTNKFQTIKTRYFHPGP
ncbi:MAG: transporter substrate-binding domain-containing protein [Desulfobacterales bacterium]|nr:transporter substrate-binding domain-containing protein [Desulfobacterales bacterium]